MGTPGQDAVNRADVLLATVDALHGLAQQVGDGGAFVLPFKGSVEGFLRIVGRAAINVWQSNSLAY